MMKISSINGGEHIQYKNKNLENKDNIKANEFGKFLKNALSSVSNMEKNQEVLEQKFMTGELENLHDLTIATQKAEIGIQTVLEVRNKVLDAYNEIMRMQI